MVTGQVGLSNSGWATDCPRYQSERFLKVLEVDECPGPWEPLVAGNAT